MPEKNRQRLGKKCYNNMFCLRWIVFVCLERFGQWQQQYLASEGIKRPKRDLCDTLKTISCDSQPWTDRKSSFCARKKVFSIIFSMSFCHVYFISSKTEKRWCSNEFFLDTLVHTEHKYFPPLMLKQTFFGLPFDGVEVAAGEKTWRKKEKQRPEAKSQNFLKTIYAVDNKYPRQ